MVKGMSEDKHLNPDGFHHGFLRKVLRNNKNDLMEDFRCFEEANVNKKMHLKKREERKKKFMDMDL